MPKKFQVRISEFKMMQATLPDRVTTRSVAILQPGSKTGTVEVADAVSTEQALAFALKAIEKQAAPSTAEREHAARAKK